jgi:hypothetical protein
MWVILLNQTTNTTVDVTFFIAGWDNRGDKRRVVGWVLFLQRVLKMDTDGSLAEEDRYNCQSINNP